MSRLDYAKNAPDYGISEALPRLNSAKVEAVKKRVEDLGIFDQIGPEDITIEDLMKGGLLKEGAARKLKNYWESKVFSSGLMACGLA